MPDYMKMYKRLFYSQMKTIEILQKAQQDTEEMYISAPDLGITGFWYRRNRTRTNRIRKYKKSWDYQNSNGLFHLLASGQAKKQNTINKRPAYFDRQAAYILRAYCRINHSGVTFKALANAIICKSVTGRVPFSIFPIELAERVTPNNSRRALKSCCVAGGFSDNLAARILSPTTFFLFSI